MRRIESPRGWRSAALVFVLYEHMGQKRSGGTLGWLRSCFLLFSSFSFSRLYNGVFSRDTRCVVDVGVCIFMSFSA